MESLPGTCIWLRRRLYCIAWNVLVYTVDSVVSMCKSKMTTFSLIDQALIGLCNTGKMCVTKILSRHKKI